MEKARIDSSTKAGCRGSRRERNDPTGAEERKGKRKLDASISAAPTLVESERSILSSASNSIAHGWKKLKKSVYGEPEPCPTPSQPATTFTSPPTDGLTQLDITPKCEPMIKDKESVAYKEAATDKSLVHSKLRAADEARIVKPSPVIAGEPVNVTTIFEPKVHYAYGKLNIDAVLLSAILQTMYREGGDDSAPLYGSKYWVFVNSIISMAHELFEKDLMHLNLTIILLCLISEVMKDENDFNFACLNGLVEKQLDGDDYGWEIDTEFMDWCVEDQVNMLIEWREMLVNKARHLHSRLSYCIVHLSGYSFNVDYKGFKPDIDFIEEAEAVFPENLLPVEEDTRLGQVGLDGEPLSDSDEEDDSDDVDEDWNDGVKCAQDEDEGIEDMYV